MRSYRDSFAWAFSPCPAWGRSWASLVVVAVWLTPQSIPITWPVPGSGWTSAGTTNEAYQWPMLSRYTRTEDGPPGRSRDHTTVRAMFPARCRRPSFSRKPRLV
jgi:hypothetical protein